MARENRRDIRVLTAVRKKIANNMVLDNRSDLANHPYCLILDIKELHLKTKKLIKRTRFVNINDSFVGQGYIW